MTICANCKSDLRESAALAIEMDALSFQITADLAVQTGQAQYGPHHLPSAEWFAVSRYFIALLRKALHGKTEGLATLAKALNVDIEKMTTPATGLPLELLPIHERVILLAGAWRMLHAGPDQFLQAARDASLSLASLQERWLSAPSCINSILSMLPDRGFASRKKDKQHSLNPRSRQAVCRMWARLLRKLR